MLSIVKNLARCVNYRYRNPIMAGQVNPAQQTFTFDNEIKVDYKVHEKLDHYEVITRVMYAIRDHPKITLSTRMAFDVYI